MSKAKRRSNAEIVRSTLSDAGIHVESADKDDPNDSEAISVSYEDGENSWVTYLFPDEDVSLVRLYSTFNFDTDRFDRGRLLEAVNYLNYRMLLDTHIEFNPIIKRLRLRENILDSSPVVNPIQFMEAFQEHEFSVGVWLQVMRGVLESNKPVDDATTDAFTKIVGNNTERSAAVTD